MKSQSSRRGEAREEQVPGEEAVHSPGSRNLAGLWAIFLHLPHTSEAISVRRRLLTDRERHCSRSESTWAENASTKLRFNRIRGPPRDSVKAFALSRITEERIKPGFGRWAAGAGGASVSAGTDGSAAASAGAVGAAAASAEAAAE